jgi:serine/threonine protein kinase
MMVAVQCSNPACGRTSPLFEDGLKRIFRCPACRRQLPRHRARDQAAAAPAAVATDGGDDGILAGAVAMAEAGDHGPPSRLGRLELRDKLGSGSFATIYLAYDSLLERDVTVKVFHPKTGAGNGAGPRPREMEHFATEMKALARLRHPQIVPIYDAGCEGSYHYISMGFIEGPTLAESLADGPLDFRTAARIAEELAEALAYAHGLGIVHRDVKPSNIVLDAHGAAHLIDFGLAHRRELEWEMSQTGVIRGTPAYLAPEQARGDDAVPHPANDQYSLGAVLYELLCGRPPFLGRPMLVLVAALQDEPARPRTLNPGVPDALEAICLKTLAKRPEDRYASCQALAEDLQRWLQGEAPFALALAGTSAPVGAAAPPVPGWRPRWLRQIRKYASTVATVLG